MTSLRHRSIHIVNTQRKTTYHNLFNFFEIVLFGQPTVVTCYDDRESIALRICARTLLNAIIACIVFFIIVKLFLYYCRFHSSCHRVVTKYSILKYNFCQK